MSKSAGRRRFSCKLLISSFRPTLSALSGRDVLKRWHSRTPSCPALQGSHLSSRCVRKKVGSQPVCAYHLSSFHTQWPVCHFQIQGFHYHRKAFERVRSLLRTINRFLTSTNHSVQYPKNNFLVFSGPISCFCAQPLNLA